MSWTSAQLLGPCPCGARTFTAAPRCTSKSRVGPCVSSHVLPGTLHRTQLLCRSQSSKTGTPATTKYVPTTARDAVETALRLQKDQQDYTESVRLYARALEMNPSEDEARAALYNLGCALAKQKKWTEASACVAKAINEYGLKLSVAQQDPDLQGLRERREWVDTVMQVKGGLSRRSRIDLRSEAKSPFRFARIVLFSGVLAGAGLGLLIITARLVASIKGGPGAPDLNESLQNFGINSAAVVILSTLVWRDVQGKKKADAITEREEALGRLQLDLGEGRQLPLVRFRGMVRPVILSGTRRFVESSLEAAKPYYQALRERGVSVVPVILDEVDAARKASSNDPEARIKALKREFMQQQAREASSKGFGAGKQLPVQPAEEEEPVEAVGVTDADKKWQLKPHDIVEWREWVDAQREFVSMPAEDRNVYIQIQMDGTVRTSGRNMPRWEKLVDDLPPLDDVRTRFTDGVGTDV